MARLIDPLFGDSASGGIAGALYYKDQGDYQAIVNRPHRISRSSPGQLAQRVKFRSCCSAWLALSSNEKLWWYENREDLPSGRAAFMQNCLNL